MLKEWLANYPYCTFSYADGQHQRHFKCLENGQIEDLFGSKGHDNERFWEIRGGG